MSRHGAAEEGTVAGLFYYPVKSLAGIRLDRAHLTERGIRHDRMWMLVRESGRFITQREEHRLALLRVSARDDGFQISAPSGDATWLPLECPPREMRKVTVWKDEVEAISGPDDAERFFTAYLGYPCLPVRMPEEAGRGAGSYAPDGTPVSFADAYPGLLIAEGSLADLNARASIPLVLDRFRPNIVISGTHPFAEDAWERVALGEAEIRCVKPCARCVLTTVDPESGTAGKEPLRTLAGYRKANGEVYFGQNFVVTTVGPVNVGDRIAVVERKEPLFPTTD